MTRIRVGIVGVGKIATDQHVPVLKASEAFELVAFASRHHAIDGIVGFPSLESLLANGPPIDAVSICTPPQMHHDDAIRALRAGKHVMLEKPPCTTTAELDHLTDAARECQRTLFQSWHSQFSPGVEPARQWLASRPVRRVTVRWKEDVRRWHPGQTWLWEAGGFGVFDPGINAISILTKIIPEAFFVTSARLQVPENCQTPIVANVDFITATGAPIVAEFNFLQTGEQIWEVDIEADGGSVKLTAAGARLSIDGRAQQQSQTGLHVEYDPMYRHFAKLIRDGRSEVDVRPFRLVADAMLIGERHTSAPFQP